MREQKTFGFRRERRVGRSLFRLLFACVERCAREARESEEVEQRVSRFANDMLMKLRRWKEVLSSADGKEATVAAAVLLLFPRHTREREREREQHSHMGKGSQGASGAQVRVAADKRYQSIISIRVDVSFASASGSLGTWIFSPFASASSSHLHAVDRFASLLLPFSPSLSLFSSLCLQVERRCVGEKIMIP